MKVVPKDIGEELISEYDDQVKLNFLSFVLIKIISLVFLFVYLSKIF